MSALSLSSTRFIRLQKFCANSPHGVSQFTKFPIACCFAHCSCFANCSLLIAVMICSSWEVPQTRPPYLGFAQFVHPRLDFHDHGQLSVSVPVSVLGRYLNTTEASVQSSILHHLHRSKPLHVHIKSVYVRTTSAHLLKCAHAESADLPRQARAKSADPWPVEYKSCDLNSIATQKQRLALFCVLLQHSLASFPS